MLLHSYQGYSYDSEGQKLLKPSLAPFYRLIVTVLSLPQRHNRIDTQIQRNGRISAKVHQLTFSKYRSLSFFNSEGKKLS